VKSSNDNLQSNQPRVLVAEDDYANQQVIGLFLKKLGFQADIAENGQRAVELAAHNEYGLILMDCQMPLLNGFEATRQIRELSAHYRTVPVIALTANEVDGIDRKCRQAGMDEILSKPMQLLELRQLLARWISN